MESSRFEILKADVATGVSAAQLLVVDEIVHLSMSRQMTEIALARRTRELVTKRACPHCDSNNVVRHGNDKNRRQRFKCRACGRTYNVMTGTPMARARKPEKWNAYQGLMTNHMSIRQIIATGIAINHVTAWRWRHRFLEAAARKNATVLCGVIEADETFFLHSFKGDRYRNKRCAAPEDYFRSGAYHADYRRSRDWVPILSALDTNNEIYAVILPSVGCIESALSGRIAAGSVLCSDGTARYEIAAENAGAEHRAVVKPPVMPRERQASPAQPLDNGRLGLNRVKSHHLQLRFLVNWLCRGVATKYLGNYLGWHRAMCRVGFVGTDLLDLALALVPL